MPKRLPRFVLACLLWLIPALAVWYYAQGFFAWLPTHLGGALLHNLYPDWIGSTTIEGATLNLHTRIADGAGAPLVFSADALLFCYGQPLLVALMLAAGTRRCWWKIPAGLLALVPLQTWGLCFFLLLTVTCAGPAAFAHTGFSQLHLNVFALAYQVGYLLMPALGPVLVWLWLDRDFLTHILASEQSSR